MKLNIWAGDVMVDISEPSKSKLVLYMPIFLDGVLIELHFGASLGYASINGKMTPYLDEMISQIFIR